jgi:hypothetical protein
MKEEEEEEKEKEEKKCANIINKMKNPMLFYVLF